MKLIRHKISPSISKEWKCFVTAIYVIAFIGMNSSAVLAQGDAGQPGEFLRYGVNARALAMGRAFTAVTDNANAVHWNPGALYDIIRDGFSFSFMFSKLYESTNYNFAAFALPIELLVSDSRSGIGGELKNWNLGFGFLALSSDDFEVRNRDNQKTGETFSDTQSAIYFSLARSFVYKGHRFGIGANYKLLSHKLFGQNADVAAFDVGLKVQPNISWLGFGLALKNINSPDFGFASGGEDVIPFSARAGVAIHPRTGMKLLDGLLLSFDFMAVPPGERDREWFVGAEYDLSRVYNMVPIKLRLGVNSQEDLSFGLNLDLPNSTFLAKSNQLLPKLDWAYLSDGATSLGGLSERFSADFSYTPYTSERWYKRGLQKFSERKFLDAREDFRRSIEAKNPGLTSFPASSLLRLGDIEVQVSEDKLNALKSSLKYYEDGFSLDRPKLDSESELNYRSAINYVQALMQEKRYNDVVRYTSVDTSWLDEPGRTLADPDVICLRSWAHYHLQEYDNALWFSQKAGNILCDFLIGIIYLHQERYEEAREVFSNISQREDYALPEQIYVHPFRDGLILDDAQFLYAYAGYKLFSPDETMLDGRQLSELAQIQRYYPLSDINKFLQAEFRFERLVNMVYGSRSNSFEQYYQQYLSAIKEGFVSIPFLVSQTR